MINFATRKLDELKFFDNFPRLKNLKALQLSINEFGFVEPIVIDQQNRVVAGEMRVRAARLENPLDLLNEIPCVVVDWDEEKCRRYRLVHNKAGEKSNWEWCNLDKELHRFPDKLEQYGFVMDEFNNEKYANIEKVFEIVEQQKLF